MDSALTSTAPEDRPQSEIGPQLIGQADEGNVRLAERRTVRNKACCRAAILKADLI